MTRWYRYIRHDDLLAYVARGWVLVDTLAGTCHGHHAFIVEWRRQGEPA